MCDRRSRRWLNRQLHVHERAVLLGAVDVGVLVGEKLASNSPPAQVVESNTMDEDHLETISKPAAKIMVVGKGDIRLLATPILTFPRQGGRDF